GHPFRHRALGRGLGLHGRGQQISGPRVYPLIPILLSLNLANPACGRFTGSTVLPARSIRCAPSAIIAVRYARLAVYSPIAFRMPVSDAKDVSAISTAISRSIPAFRGRGCTMSNAFG